MKGEKVTGEMVDKAGVEVEVTDCEGEREETTGSEVKGFQGTRFLFILPLFLHSLGRAT